MLHEQDLTSEIIGAAIEVHRNLGPGLLESAYKACWCHELRLRNIPFVCEESLPLEYKGLKLECGYRIDVGVDDRVIVELKCVEETSNLHKAQLLTYLKLSGKKIGLILNF